jgi:hypothetical protein
VVNLQRGNTLDLTGKSSLIQALTDERDWLRQRVLLLDTQLKEQEKAHSKDIIEILDRFRPKPGAFANAGAVKGKPATRFPSDPGIARPPVPEVVEPSMAEQAIMLHLGYKNTQEH